MERLMHIREGQHVSFLKDKASNNKALSRSISNSVANPRNLSEEIYRKENAFITTALSSVFDCLLVYGLPYFQRLLLPA